MNMYTAVLIVKLLRYGFNSRLEFEFWILKLNLLTSQGEFEFKFCKVIEFESKKFKKMNESYSGPYWQFSSNLEILDYLVSII